MKLISSDSGTVLQKIDIDEVRPVGGFNIPEVIRLVAERYGFSEKSTPAEAAKEGARFVDGRLISGNNRVNIRELKFGGDAIGITAFDTNGAEFVLEDLFSWARETIGLRPIITKHPKIFHSVIIVEFEADIEQLFSAFKKAEHLYGQMLAALYDFHGRIGPSRFAISRDTTDQTTVSALPHGDIQWTFERRVGVSYSLNRYISGAPIRTEMNSHLLETLEEALR